MIREATPEQVAEVLSILDAAALATDTGKIERAIDAGDVLVALPDSRQVEGEDMRQAAGSAENATGPVLGALVLDGEEVAAVAVRPKRRGQGIGSALVGEALDRRGRLVAEFDPRVRPFWESLDCEITPIPSSDRLRAVFGAGSEG